MQIQIEIFGNKVVFEAAARESGTGIGLILCKEFIKKNKGEIFVESVEIVGSKFAFTIPLAKKNDRIIQKA
ncbi:MAG TPA: hypothetical protein DCG75_15045 [Bacteroidales bacterium]|nr:hypothetical protein [Bacteroidales bacterium]